MITATLCYIIKGGKILLIKKKSGLGNGFWNGPGGKVDEKETIEEAASREVYEEIGIVPDNPKKIGEIEFYFGQEDKADWYIHVFVSWDYDGIEKETEEAMPKWFPLSKVPFKEMWPDDEIWMPFMLQGKRFHGKFYFDKSAEKLIRHEVNAIQDN